MKHYIDKSAVVAEIERIMNEQQEICKADVALGKAPDSKNIEVIYQFQQFTKFLDTLEVKEIGVDISSPEGNYNSKTVQFIDADGNIKEITVNKAQNGKSALEAAKEEKVDNQNCVKPADKVEPKFKIGDWVVYYRNNSSREVLQVYDIRDSRYYFTDNVHFSWSVKECDEKSHLWTISDAKAGDVLFHSDSASNGIFIFKELLKCGFSEKVICYCDYDSEDGFCLGEHHTCCWVDAKILHPATKEQCDILFSKIKDAGYKWDVEKKELKIIDWGKHIKYNPNAPSIIETNSKWSEEDKKLTDVNHEYFSELLENDDSKDINDYAYQVAYCMSHDWIEEIATWDDVQKACKLGAEWNEKRHKSDWSEEDNGIWKELTSFFNDDKPFMTHSWEEYSKWILSLKERIGGKL